MSRCYVDANFLYVHLRNLDHGSDTVADRWWDGTVMRSMASRLHATWDAIDEVGMEVEPTGPRTIAEAKALMAGPGLAPRDAFHAAHAMCAGCSVIASTDVAFDRVSGIRRVGPPGLN